MMFPHSGAAGAADTDASNDAKFLYVPGDLLQRAAHAIRTDSWFRDEDIDAIRREAAVLKAIEYDGLSRKQAGARFDAGERSADPLVRGRIESDRHALRFILRALASCAARSHP
jgi:hypothetical protein